MFCSMEWGERECFAGNLCEFLGEPAPGGLRAMRYDMIEL